MTRPESTRRPTPWLIALLRVGCVRFTVYYLLASYSAFLGRRNGEWSWFWFGIAVAVGVTNCVAIELTNRWADQRQDWVNCPERTAACAALGFRRLGLIAMALYLLQACAYGVWQFLDFNPELLAIQVASWFVGWNYSTGMRLKQLRYGALLVLTATFVLPFLWGWTLEHGGFTGVPVAILVMPAFVVSLAGAKDLTDVEGDATVGYRGFFVDLVNAPSSTQLLLTLCAPYLFCGALVVVGLAPPRLLLLCLLSPLSIAFAIIARAATKQQAFAVREFMYHLHLVILAAIMSILFPFASVGLFVIGAALAWLLSTRYLHWHSGLRLHDVRALVDLLRASRQPIVTR